MNKCEKLVLKAKGIFPAKLVISLNDVLVTIFHTDRNKNKVILNNSTPHMLAVKIGYLSFLTLH